MHFQRMKESCWNRYGKTDAIVTVYITVYARYEEASGAEIQFGNGRFVSDTPCKQ